jgi:tetratricopeptide (TPR) repeat protein
MSTRNARTAVLLAASIASLAIGVAALAVPDNRATRSVVVSAGTASSPAGGALDARIARSQVHLRQVPGDWQEWATLGLDYVEQAKVTVDPTYYPKATAALERSLRLEGSDNFVAMAGEAALAAARHDFRDAMRWARRGLRIDPESAVLMGALTDALTQLGHYRAADATARRMELLRPGADAEARLSYAAELRGETSAARVFMRQALRHAVTGSDAAFARYYLGELALNSGRPRAALHQYDAGLRADPSYVALREGRAKAEAALGRFSVALRDLADVVARVPQPSYLLEYAALLQALGRDSMARQQYDVFRVEERLFRANGVRLDTDQTLFEADHGDPAVAVAAGRAALRTRPFVESWDAYAWALHRAGHDRAALVAADRALATGMRNALFHFHRGVIEHALRADIAARRDIGAALRINATFSPLQAPIARRLLTELRGAR